MLELINVTKKYTDDKSEHITALENVSLSLPDTGLVIITGTSGCGKTTLLNILGGLDRPTSGEVHYEDVRIDNKNEKWWDAFRGYHLGFIYQDFNLLENMTVRENIQLPLSLQNTDVKTMRNRVHEISDELGLNEYMNKKTGKLSGGQKQRVAIARALVTGSDIILADEPTGNLDRENSVNVFKLLKKIASKRLVVVVTHDATLAGEYADRLIHISYGNIESDNIIEENKNVKTEGISFLNNSNSVENKKTRLSLIECFKFAKEAMNQRKTRCFVSVMIFSITMLFILLSCEMVFRNDSVPITKHIIDGNQKLVPLCMEIPDEYKELYYEEKICTGRNIYDLVCKNVDNSRFIRGGGSVDISYGEDKIYGCSKVFVGMENKKYFTFEGEFPEKENEIAISKTFADKLGNSENIIGSSVLIKENEYIITAIVTKVCGKDIKDIHVIGSYTDSWDEDIVFLTNQFLTNNDITSKIYMSGFGVTSCSNLIYQTTVYNNVTSSDGVTELIEGRMPSKDNEILISRYLYEISCELDREVLDVTFKLEDLYKEEYGCSFWDRLNLYDYIGESFTVVGVAEGNADYYVTTSLYDKLFNEYMTYYEESNYLLVDESVIETDIFNLMESDIKIDDAQLQRVYDLIKNIDSLKMIIVMIAGAIALLSMLQMISLYTYSINDNKKTIGILRTLGVNKVDTSKIFTVECIVVSLISFTVAICFSILVTSVINDLICESVLWFDISILRMRFIVVLITGLVNCALSALSVLIPIRKFSKVKIIELIK